MQTIYTTITNIDFYQTLIKDSFTGKTEWTINKNAKPGDIVLLYVCSPKSAIVATAIVADIPYQELDLNSMWFRGWFAEMENLKMLNHAISRKELLNYFPDWGYWKQPRNSIAVPKHFETKIKELVYEQLKA